MKAKEKAKELVDKMYFYIGDIEPRIEKAKYCALIAVDEMIEQWKTKNMGWHCDCVHHGEMYNYWQEVKQEIEKL